MTDRQSDSKPVRRGAPPPEKGGRKTERPSGEAPSGTPAGANRDAPPLLRAENISRTLPGDIPARLVRGASLDVQAGEFIAITGPSGSGKSSLLYLLGLLDRPTEGRVLIEGQDTTDLSDDARAALRLEKIGFVFQSHFLLPEFTALENVTMPLRRRGGLSEKDITARGMELLAGLGLADHAHKRPRQMSGGQSQRVAVARALANDPLLILADEPTGNLDTAASATVRGILRDLTLTRKRAVITVTHDQDFAAMAARRIHIVDGQIDSDGPGAPPDAPRPKNARKSANKKSRPA